MFLRTILIFVAFSGFLLTAFAQQRENLTITTYYPSPYGSYNELTISSRMAVGDVNGDGKVDTNDLAVDTSGNALINTITVAGNIGIGTRVPLARLDVNGGIRVGNTNNCISGTIKYANNNFEGCVNGVWKSMTQPVGAVFYGGWFLTSNIGHCEKRNPMTGACSCPSGFTDDQDGFYARCNGPCYIYYIHMCYRN